MLLSTKSFLCVSRDFIVRFPIANLYRRAMRWTEQTIGALLYFYCRFCASTSRIQMTERAAHHLGLAETKADPWVVTFWHEDFLLWPVAAQHASLPWSVWIHNDTFGGRLVKEFCGRTGLPTVELARKSGRKEKLNALLETLRTKGRIGIAADYGEPWFKVHPTASQLARQASGVVIAMHISAPMNPRVGFGDHRLRLPVPFSRYEIRASSRVDPVQLGSDRKAIQSITSKLQLLQDGLVWKTGQERRPHACIFGSNRHQTSNSVSKAENPHSPA
jgi:lysophospholipid acyltransferase (LPLAT)-like uncharacterized protein